MAAFGRKNPDAPRIPRNQRKGVSTFKVGAVVLAVLAAAVYFGFSKHVPFTHGFRVKAVFPSANSIRVNSPVRIAGVNVGKVKDVSRQSGTNAAVVTMEIDKQGLPIHKDATVKIRPRIFLEGNFFVDMEPGTPGTPTLGDGDTLPIAQASDPVQLDQVLTALQQDTRAQLQELLDNYGKALTAKPTPAQDAQQDPSVHGLTAAEALNQSYKYGGPAFKNVSIVNNAFLGEQPHDLSNLIAGLDKTTQGLDRNEGALKDLITNFNTTMASFASQSGNLRQSIHLLAPTLDNADKALTSLNNSFPNTRAFAREILPGVRETPATIAASFPWIAQTRKLLGQSELRGLVQELSPATADLARLTDRTLELLPQADLIAKCATNLILPTGDIKIADGPLTSNAENYKEFWYAMVGLAGEGQNFDGNGMYVRFQPGGGDQTISSGSVGPYTNQTLFANAVAAPLGTRPAFSGHRTPYKPDVPCYTQKIPDLNGAATGPPDGGGSASAARSAIARSAARQAQAQQGGLTADSSSLTSQLVSRLNPFRGEKGK
jgi:phospholipid/cholesterol/gamma-HCH transport system substrate-binding protein